jgi:uncharacterized protein with ParB-like and HNH nuclease domain
MKADAFEVGSILRQRQRFEVPIYQRHYAWGDDRLEPFWEDVRTKADERLDAKPRRFAHYMGALLVMPEGGYQVGRVPTFNVVDGQQRLCTFEIFLEAAKNTLGNLTLLTSSANPSLSNLPFNGEREQNKREFLRSSLLKMNQEIANCSTWDEAAIERRAERLATLATALWPIPAAAEATTSASAVAAE